MIKCLLTTEAFIFFNRCRLKRSKSEGLEEHMMTIPIPTIYNDTDLVKNLDTNTWPDCIRFPRLKEGILGVFEVAFNNV